MDLSLCCSLRCYLLSFFLKIHNFIHKCRHLGKDHRVQTFFNAEKDPGDIRELEYVYDKMKELRCCGGGDVDEEHAYRIKHDALFFTRDLFEQLSDCYAEIGQVCGVVDKFYPGSWFTYAS